VRQEKQYLKDAIVEPIDKHNAFVIMSYERISANKINQFRRDIASIGGAVKMTRKRILTKAFQTAGINFSLDQFSGHVGVVFSGEDAIESVKAAFKFCDDSGKTASIIGGRIDGKVYNGQDVETLSKLPSKDQMRAEFLATLEAPMAQTLAVMDALLSSVVYCLDNKCKNECEPELG